ncbi:hypothetical protein COU76_02205 [Candidatus Peregrinibacteria bacterium CG10_big_fil_rev_8_21_14_0_10_49_10]|nr:MAG: hypothetical protein COU76_02205 [Candidatus Peregrinibacteria bacterium CG10_big_fil_rev_8_21_14_0_10_49_10]
MDHISSLLTKVLQKRGLTSHAEASLLILRCREWLTEHLPECAQELHPQTFTDGVLAISCDHSIAAQECRQQTEALLSHLREVCPGIAVEQIRLLRGV